MCDITTKQLRCNSVSSLKFPKAFLNQTNDVTGKPQNFLKFHGSKLKQPFTGAVKKKPE